MGLSPLILICKGLGRSQLPNSMEHLRPSERSPHVASLVVPALQKDREDPYSGGFLRPNVSPTRPAHAGSRFWGRA